MLARPRGVKIEPINSGVGVSAVSRNKSTSCQWLTKTRASNFRNLFSLARSNFLSFVLYLVVANLNQNEQEEAESKSNSTSASKVRNNRLLWRPLPLGPCSLYYEEKRLHKVHRWHHACSATRKCLVALFNAFLSRCTKCLTFGSSQMSWQDFIKDQSSLIISAAILLVK